MTRRLEEFFQSNDLQDFVDAIGDDGGFTEMDGWKAEEIVAHCNHLFREWVNAQPKIYGSQMPNGEIGYRWFKKPWASGGKRTSHQATLINIQPIEGKHD